MNKERVASALNGWAMLLVTFLVFAVAISLIVKGSRYESGWFILSGLLGILLTVFSFFGFFTLEPNQAQVLVLMGAYRGTVRKSGFHWANPLSVPFPRFKYTVRTQTGTVISNEGHPLYKVSLRVRNFESGKLKVNDKRGNPIEIAAVIVWRVEDTAQALFDVDHYENFVTVQSEAALRHVATSYPYDHLEGEDELTLRGNVPVVSEDLKKELHERLTKAGVVVEETRLTHLAYAPEIANAMLRRQQAEAIIAARQKIVHGAVGMVEMALAELSEKKVLELDEERKAAMVSNLLVVLCGEAEAQPVLNTGTLYP